MTEASGGSETADPKTGGPLEDAATDNGPVHSTSSDGEAAKPAPKRRHRRRTPRSEPGNRDASCDGKTAAVRKPSRAKSQPPVGTKENQRPPSRLDWSERPNDVSHQNQIQSEGF